MKDSGQIIISAGALFYLGSVLIPTSLLKFELVHPSVFTKASPLLWGGAYATFALFLVVVFLGRLIGIDELRSTRGTKDLFSICEWVYFGQSMPQKRRWLAVAICVVYMAMTISFSCSVGFGTFAITLLKN
jgi:hypothetical protein